MNELEITQFIMASTKDIAGLKQNYTALEKRADENDRVTTGIHRLAANTESLTAEVKRLAEKLENGLREQGKRIGEVEAAIIKLSDVNEVIKALQRRVDSIEREPAAKWKSFVWLVVSGVVTAVVAFFMARAL